MLTSHTHILSALSIFALQLIMPVTAGPTKVRHGHDLDYQAGPAGEVLGALPAAHLRVILLPRKAGLDPAGVDGVDDVGAQAGV